MQICLTRRWIRLMHRRMWLALLTWGGGEQKIEMAGVKTGALDEGGEVWPWGARSEGLCSMDAHSTFLTPGSVPTLGRTKSPCLQGLSST